MTLFQWIRENKGKEFPRSADVEEFGFDIMYVRIGRYLNPNREWVQCLTFARIKARMPGEGYFTRLIDTIQLNFPNLWIYVENVHNVRLGPKLESIGFTRDPNWQGSASYYLEPLGALTPVIQKLNYPCHHH